MQTDSILIMYAHITYMSSFISAKNRKVWAHLHSNLENILTFDKVNPEIN